MFMIIIIMLIIRCVRSDCHVAGFKLTPLNGNRLRCNLAYVAFADPKVRINSFQILSLYLILFISFFSLALYFSLSLAFYFSLSLLLSRSLFFLKKKRKGLVFP